MNALFSKTDKNTKQSTGTPAVSSAVRKEVLFAPHITEKATMLQEQGAYVFEIAPSATKRDVSDAVRRAYGVVPRMVRIVKIQTKQKRNARTGRTGVKGGGRKAYVFLKEGETITIA